MIETILLCDFRYRQDLRKEMGKDTLISDEELLGDLYTVYYNNKDLKLLLDLLATSSGIATSLRVLALFDKNLRFKSEPDDLRVSLVSYHDAVEESDATMNEEGQTTENPNKPKVYDVDVEFGDAKAFKELFSQIKKAAFVYTVEINPPTARSSIKAIKPYVEALTGVKDAADVGVEMQPLTTIQNVTPEHRPKTSRMKVSLYDLDPRLEYSIRVCTIVNGKTISRKTEKLKSKEQK